MMARQEQPDGLKYIEIDWIKDQLARGLKYHPTHRPFAGTLLKEFEKGDVIKILVKQFSLR